jgi:hypothetical protein
MHRRKFCSTAVAAMAMGLAPSAQGHSGDSPMNSEDRPRPANNPIPRVTSAGTMRGEMLYRELGATGESVSVIGMGGSHLGLAKSAFSVPLDS